MAERIAQTAASEPTTASEKERALSGSQSRIPIRARIAAGIFMIPGFAGIIACGGSGDSAQVTLQTPTSTTEAKATVADGGVKVKVGDTATATSVSGGNDGGSKGGNVTVVPTEASKPPTATPTKVEPTATPIKEVAPTETPKPAIKTILDQPVVPTAIASIKSTADSFYAIHPEASDWRQSNGGIFTKQNLDTGLAYCEAGSPEDRGNASTLRASRESACYFVVTGIYDLYKQHGNPEFLQIALGARNSFETAYPERKTAFEAGLRARGVN